MKKGFSVLIALLFVCLSATPAFAADDDLTDTPPADAVEEYGYWYIIEQTADGPAFSYLRFIPKWLIDEGETVYIPKSLGGITLTPENFNGSVFYPWEGPRQAFAIDDDNAYFTLIDGVLYTKDGKTLVCFPPRSTNASAIIRFPENVCGFANGCVLSDTLRGRCLAFPDSVADIPDDAFPGDSFAVAGSTGSAAQRFAEARGVQFVPMGEDHTHVYFHDEEILFEDKGQTLIEVCSLICPCGDVLETKRTSWDLGRESSCKCMCHKMRSYDAPFGFKEDDTPIMIARKLLYCLRRMIWQLLGVRQYCECGARHW